MMASEDNHPTSKTPKILLVDDREDNLLSIEAILEPDGYQFVRAYSGHQALKILLNEFDFAMILMDVKMPVLNGFETATLIYEREKLRQVPIMFITANNYGDENIFKGYKAGGIDYIFKPINPEVLRVKVAVFIDIYNKNVLLIEQEQQLSLANKRLEREITELKLAEDRVKQLNVRLQNEASDLTSILVSSKLSSDHLEFENCDLNGLIKDLLVDIEYPMNKKMATISVEPLPVLMVSRILIRPLFQRLIQSALDSSGERRIIKIRSEIGGPTEVANSKRGQNNNYCHIIIEDNRMGIDENGDEKGFTGSGQIQKNGGLSKTNHALGLVKKIMERHNGLFHTRSTANKGTMFIVSFPVAK